MAGDLVIEEGDLEVLRDRTRDLSSRLQSVTVARRATTSPLQSGEARSQDRGAVRAKRLTRQSLH